LKHSLKSIAVIFYRGLSFSPCPKGPPNAFSAGRAEGG
jgi:hypothetical protein